MTEATGVYDWNNAHTSGVYFSDFSLYSRRSIMPIWIVVLRITEPQTIFVSSSIEKLREYLKKIGSENIDVYYIPSINEGEVYVTDTIRGIDNDF